MAKTGSRNDPHLISTFHVEIDGVDQASFRKCSGLKTETEIFEYQEGGDNETVRKLVGQTKHSNIVLTQGYTADPSFFKWRDEIHTGDGAKIKRRNGSIIAYADDNKTEIGRWNFEKAWPIRWEMSEFDGSTGQAAVETLELSVDRITKGK
jgi:phage tail-like protein